MRDSRHTVQQELHGILAFVGAIWAVFLISCFAPSLDNHGVVPRTLAGLVGILAMPFLHADLHHIVGNTVPLLVLLALLAGSRAQSWEIVVEIILLGGGLLWLTGPDNTDHIGASGLIFGLVAFLVLSGFLEKRPVPLLISVLVGFLYGSTLIWGVLPHPGSRVSWQGHLCGAVAGAAVAYALTRKPGSDPGLQPPSDPAS
jgi:membrane associated rhomboid family serine protease